MIMAIMDIGLETSTKLMIILEGLRPLSPLLILSMKINVWVMLDVVENNMGNTEEKFT